jgi:hypothetical protein
MQPDNNNNKNISKIFSCMMYTLFVVLWLIASFLLSSIYASGIVKNDSLGFRTLDVALKLLPLIFLLGLFAWIIFFKRLFYKKKDEKQNKVVATQNEKFSKEPNNNTESK